MNNNQQSTLLGIIAFLCFVNLLIGAYLLKNTFDKNGQDVTPNVSTEKNYDELNEKLDKFFEKQNQDMQKLFEGNK